MIDNLDLIGDFAIDFCFLSFCRSRRLRRAGLWPKGASGQRRQDLSHGRPDFLFRNGRSSQQRELYRVQPTFEGPHVHLR